MQNITDQQTPGQRIEFAPGFRISLTDVTFIIIFGLWLWYAYSIDAGLFIISAWPPAQFFLFCNVFRVERKSELMWVFVYLAVSIPCYVAGISALVPILTGMIAGFVAIACETRKPSYHGIFWQHFNPGLEQWFNQNFGTSKPD